MTDDEADVIWSLGPIQVVRLDCPYCDESWRSMFIIGAIIQYMFHCERNRDTHLVEE